ncbi:MAG: KUP/HAK/KT family potassium transporter [Bacteroidota bacterium]
METQYSTSTSNHKKIPLSVAGLIVTLGIVFGDLGTSPLYVMKAIVSAAGGKPDANFIIGTLSCIIWTLTLQTTLKYVIITLRADNNGEGGIFSLFALMRKKVKWAYVIAVVGGCTLLADGIITPSITVTSAIEGLRIISPTIPVIPIVILIIIGLFVAQQFGTVLLGKAFGPIMFLWFLMLGVLGLSHLWEFPQIFVAFNPLRAISFLIETPSAVLVLGAVFLCTTGAEALYSDLGHCGYNNIKISWIYVKVMLILNYLGQGAWIISHPDLASGNNPFFAIMPEWFIIPGIIIATLAAVIASQALISGSFTIISEAISLNFWPSLKISYPTKVKGQMYIPTINWLLMISCILVIFYFQDSSAMEAAYGLSITITMLMTTILLSIYFHYIKKISAWIIGLFLMLFVPIEGVFLLSNINKFVDGGFVTIIIASILFVIMYVWYQGRKIKNSFISFEKIDKYIPILCDLSKDDSISKYSTHLVNITKANHLNQIESKIMYSIIRKSPKRADVYWFIHYDRTDLPYQADYEVNEIVSGKIIRLDFRIGFKVQPRINLFFHQVVEELQNDRTIDLNSRYQSLNHYNIEGDYRFVVIDRIQNYDFDFKPFQQILMNLYYILKQIGISDIKSLGLDSSLTTIETVPLLSSKKLNIRLKRNIVKPLKPKS